MVVLPFQNCSIYKSEGRKFIEQLAEEESGQASSLQTQQLSEKPNPATQKSFSFEHLSHTSASGQTVSCLHIDDATLQSIENETTTTTVAFSELYSKSFYAASKDEKTLFFIGKLQDFNHNVICKTKNIENDAQKEILLLEIGQHAYEISKRL